jgi:hypothetical protein
MPQEHVMIAWEHNPLLIVFFFGLLEEIAYFGIDIYFYRLTIMIQITQNNNRIYACRPTVFPDYPARPQYIIGTPWYAKM